MVARINVWDILAKMLECTVSDPRPAVALNRYRIIQNSLVRSHPEKDKRVVLSMCNLKVSLVPMQMSDHKIFEISYD